jgi:ribosomal protein S18 acetylase RimI-like enzyme
MNYEMRQAAEGDYRYCYTVTKKNMAVFFTRHWGGWAPAAFRRGFNAGNVTMILVAGRRAGYISLRKEENSLYIDNFQLSSPLCGRGIGTRVLTEFLTRHSGQTFRLTTFDDNPAKRLYERLGFVVTERNDMTVKMTRFPDNAAVTQ